MYAGMADRPTRLANEPEAAEERNVTASSARVMPPFSPRMSGTR